MSDTITPTDRIEAEIKEGKLLYSTASLARAVERSNQFIRNDIRDGYLRAAKGGKGERASFLIEIAEAERYAKWLASGRPAS